MRRLRLLTLFCLVITITIAVARRDAGDGVVGQAQNLEPSWMVQSDSTLTPEADRRPADQTFLTFPEWYLVFGPGEQAEYYRNNTSTTFPLMSQVDNVWESYDVISRQIEPYFEYNEDYHFMIQFIGVSTSVEYGLKSAYELVIGRLTDPGQGVQTAEDRFTYEYTRDYVDFLGQQPWYRYDYMGELERLWTDTDFLGPHFLRKMERRYFLTSELLVKAAYGQLVGMGTGALYDGVIPSTVVVVDSLPQVLKEDPVVEVMEQFPDGSALLRLPRYAAFGPAAANVARAGVSFKEIAGNDSAILLTLLADVDFEFPSASNSSVLFEQASDAGKAQKRLALVTTVPELANVLNQLDSLGLTLEHVYDY